MNAMPISSPANCPEDMDGHGSDTDSNHEETPDYYQPISAIGDDDDYSSSDSDSDRVDIHRNPSSILHHLPNGLLEENGIAPLSINDKSSDEDGDDDNEEEQEEERAREVSNLAMERAFREDESRRSAPLRPEDAVRVMEAMRGVSFGGSAPDWARRMPEDQWIQQLRRLRQPPGSAD